MVAKSYQHLQTLSDPYESKGRMYIKVRTAQGFEKQVRWYTEDEYYKMYPEEKKVNDPYYRSQKDVLGFENGFITIFKGNTFDAKDYLKEHGARYTKFWGWSFGSTVELPEDLPETLEPIRLEWSAVGLDNGNLKPEDQVKEAVDSVVCDPSPSEFVGEINERLDLNVRIKAAIELEGYYGKSTMHIMEDDAENVYVWTTSAKYLNPESWYHIRGTVKDHRVYKNTKQTVLTRCKVIED